MFQGKEYVYEVYKTKSFSKAASNLYISQPALSATIKKIEGRLGTPIFDRSTNPIRLTYSGQQYIQSVEAIIDIESRFDNYLNDLKELRTGHLAIGGSNLFSSYILPSLLSKFMEKYPMIEIKLVEDTTKSLEQQLLIGSLDLIIDNYPFSDKIYDKAYFKSEQLLLAVPTTLAINESLRDKELSVEEIRHQSHMDDDVPYVSITDFKDCPFLLLRSGNDTRERSDQVFKNANFIPNIVLKLDQQVTAYHVACSGMGITLISDTLIKEVPRDPRITYYKLKDPIVNRNIYFYYKHTKYITRAMNEFLSLACPEYRV